jgi:UDP-glucose 4-epimerase
MKSIVVTGATSMIGVALIESAIAGNEVEQIYAVIHPGTKKIHHIPKDPRIHIVPCDLSNYETLPKLISGFCEVFYHLAWPRTETYQENLEDICGKIESVRAELIAVKVAKELGCSKFVGVGSQSEYGVSCAEKLSPELPCNPIRADGILKFAAGKLAGIQAEHYGISCIWMRIFSVYGRYDRPNSMISTTIGKLHSKKHCSFTASQQLWDYLNVEDAGLALYLAGKFSTGHKIYCVGSGDEQPLYRFIETIRDVVDPTAELGIGELPYPENPIMRLCADISTLQNDTGWKPQIQFKDGIRKLYRQMLEDRCI